MEKQTKCLVDSHESVIEGICFNQKCSAPQRLVCIECTQTIHAQCLMNFRLKKEFLKDLQQLKDTILVREQDKIKKLQLLKDKLVQQITLLNQNINSNCLNTIKRIDLIISTPWTQQSWMDGYDLLSNKEIQSHNWDVLKVQLSDIQTVIDEMLNIQKSRQNEQNVSSKEKPFMSDWSILAKDKPLVIHTNQSIYCTALSPDGKQIASAGQRWGEAVQFWNIKTGTLLGSKVSYSFSKITSMKYSPSGNFIVQGGQEKTIYLWNLMKNNFDSEPLKLQGHTEYVQAIDITPDEQFVISGSKDKTIRFWDVRDGKEIFSRMIYNDQPVSSLAISKNNCSFAFGDQRGTLRMWDVVSNKSIASLKGHTLAILSINFSNDSNLLVSAGYDSSIRIWSMQTYAQIKVFQGHNYSFIPTASFSPDMLSIVSGGNNKTVRIWDVKSGQQTRVMNMHRSAVYSAQFSYDGKYLITAGCEDQEIIIQQLK